MSDRGHFARTADVSRETLDRFDIYASLLEKWNPAINLVAKSTLSELWSRHFLDSAQILSVIGCSEGHWADLGSGGGFPGLVVAILASEMHPELKVTCIESDLRKATFLRTVIRETGLDAQVRTGRVELIEPLAAEVVSARALAPLTRLLGYAARHLAVGGDAVFLKGAGVGAELQEALETWTFRLDTYPSKTDPEATILRIGDIRRV